MRPGAAFFVCVALFSTPDWAHVSLSTRSAAASTSIELSVAELVSKSTLVLAGTPLDSRSLWEESEGGRGRRIVTYTRLRVDRLIDGNAASEVWVRTLGGEVDDIGQHVDGEAVLVPQKPALLFLRAIAGGTHGVVGMAQGQYPLDRPPAGTPVRVLAPVGLGKLVPKAGAPTLPNQSPSQLPARLVLSGQTLDDAARLVLAERRAHAP
jgi:hypothetical protein